MSSLISHEIELVDDEPKKKPKSIALKSKGKKENSKALQVKEDLEESELNDPSEDSDD